MNILITGANRGIGLALSRVFLEMDHRVFAGSRHPERSDSLSSLSGNGRLEIVQLDVTSGDSVQKAVQAVRHRTDRLDVLINNAGVFLEDVDTSIEDLEVELFDQTCAVNVTGVARVTQAFLPMLAASKFPRIVNISSGAGSINDRSDRRYYCYGASKAALNHFTRGLAFDLKNRGVVVAAISPGWVRTEMGGENAELTAEESADSLANTILNLKADDSGAFLNRFGGREGYRW